MSEEKTVVARECRFAFHIPTRSRDFPDLHLVKEIVHYSDGTIVPNKKFIKDFKRSFFVTKPQFRDHEQKKESESLDKLTKYECTQSNLRFQVAKALDQAYSPLPLDKLAASPYLYGSDISSSCIIKHAYAKKYPDIFTKYTVCTFDIETDVLHGTDDPIMATLVMKGKLFHIVSRDFLKGYSDVEEIYRSKLNQHLKPYLDKYQFEIEFMLADNPVQIITECLKRLHTWMPDMVMVWNINFDIPRCLDTLKKYGVDAKDVFCDPDVPVELRYCRYKKASPNKITASGQLKPKNPSEQWHSLLCPASFVFIDQMSGFRFLRLGGQEEQRYDLDAILQKVLGIRKLNFTEAERLKGLDWHKFMQAKYPFEYMVYNNFDCIGTYELDEATSDISMSAPSLVGISEFSRLDSQTKRFADAYHFYLLENVGEVVGTIPPSKKKDEGEEEEAPDFIMQSEDDCDDEEEETAEAAVERVFVEKDSVLNLRGWIKTLRAHMSALGLCLIAEMANLRTMIRCFIYDSDALAAYPSCTAVANVSRATTKTEIIDIVGRDEAVFRKNGVNLLHGHVNAVEYCHEMLKLPSLDESLVLFEDMY